jgi:hypothetical protein
LSKVLQNGPFLCLQSSPPIFANCRLVPQTTSPESSPVQSNTTCQPLIGSKATWLPIKGAFTAMCQNQQSQGANSTNTIPFLSPELTDQNHNRFQIHQEQ